MFPVSRKPCIRTGMFISAFLAISATNAQPGDADYELVTTAIHRRSSETALPVTVLGGDELHSLSRSTLGDTLANQPGINNASFGPAVGQTVIRGQQGRRVLNMSNGIPSTDASGNSSDHALTVEAILADSVEVLRGPSTLLYGGGAIGGVVNVIDRRIPLTLPQTPELSLEARHDNASDQNNLIGRTEFSTGNFAWHLHGLTREWNDLSIPGYAIAPEYLDEEDHDDEEHTERNENTDGYITNTGGKTSMWTAGGSRVFDNGFIGLSINKLDNLYGLPAGTHEHHDVMEGEHEHEEEEHEAEEEQVKIDMHSTRYDLAGEWRSPGAFIETWNYRLSFTDYAHSEMEAPNIVGTTFSNESWQQRLQLTHREVAGFHGVLGVQTTDEEFGAAGEESFIPVTDITSRGIFLVEDFHTGDITWEFGGRINRDTYKPLHGQAEDLDFTTSSQSVSALWDISTPVTVGINLSRSERPPSIEELYSNDGLALPDDCVLHLATASCEIGNNGLDTETALNTDLTLYLDLNTVSATVTAFHNNFSDYIYQRNTGVLIDEFTVREYAQSDTRFSGLEAEISFDLGIDWQLKFFGDVIDSHIDAAGDVPRMPPARFGTELQFSRRNWNTRVSVLHAFDQNDPGENELSTEGYTRIDLGVEYTLGLADSSEILLFLRGRNLADEEIRLATSFLRGYAPEAGRSLETGIRYRF